MVRTTALYIDNLSIILILSFYFIIITFVIKARHERFMLAGIEYFTFEMFFMSTSLQSTTPVENGGLPTIIS
jgi:hypothetical protein